MKNWKYIWESYRKEIVLGLLLCSFILFGLGIYFLMEKKEPEEENIISEELFTKQEEIVEEEQIEEDTPIQIDIKGEIISPGVYTVESGSRIIDVIQMAGGLTKTADTSVNNLSRKVEDEMVIIIYSKKEVEDFSKTKEEEKQLLEEIKQSSPTLSNDALLTEKDILENANSTSSNETKKEEENIPSNSNSDSSTEQKISINTATKEELMSLDGIGESKAQAIIDYRNEFGPFQKIEDILQVSGIGESAFAKIKDYIQV